MRRRGIICSVGLSALAAGLWGSPACAQSNRSATESSESISPLEITGLVLGLMVSPLGYEFLARFNEYWSEKQGYETISLNITERFSRRAGSRVVVVYDGNSVYAGNIPFRSGLIRAFAADVAEKVYANIAALALKTSSEDPDMASGGF